MLMVYRCPDGATFNSYQAMCDHMIGLARMQGNREMVEYYKREKEKMNQRQEKGFPVFAIVFIIGVIVLVILGLSGGF